MTRRICIMVVLAVLLTPCFVWAAEYGTAAEAKTMLERAVLELQKDKAKALDMFY